MRSVEILGHRLDLVDPPELDTWVDAALFEPWDGRCRHIVTLNPEYVMAARRDASFASVIGGADLVTSDGVGVAVAARILHGRSVRRITGVELVERLAGSGIPMFLLGAGPGVADLTAARLERRFPGSNVAGVWSDGTADPADDEPTLLRIIEAKAQAVAVAYGAPNQVLWIHRNQHALAKAGVKVAIGVGGSFDYLSGVARRPPRLARKLGLEWLFRLAREPHRWRRQRVLPVFAVLVLADAIKSRILSRSGRSE